MDLTLQLGLCDVFTCMSESNVLGEDASTHRGRPSRLPGVFGAEPTQLPLNLLCGIGTPPVSITTMVPTTGTLTKADKLLWNQPHLFPLQTFQLNDYRLNQEGH